MRFFSVIGAILVIGLAIALGAGLYQAGLAAGAAGAAGSGGAVAVPYPWYGVGFGFGFGLFHLFWFLLAVILIAAVLRALFWGGRMRGGWGRRDGWGARDGSRGGPGWSGPGSNGDWEQRVREYHDRLHGGEPPMSGQPTSGHPTQPGSGA